METKVVPFLYGMAKAFIYPYRTIALESKYAEMVDAIKNAVGDGSDIEANTVAGALSDALVMTDKLEFNWHDETPSNYRNIEDFWALYKSGEPVQVWYEYLRVNVPSFIIVQWSNAVINGQTIWKPPVQKKPQGTQDPN